ncbi:MAG: 5'-nucleotidase C-terminal domain-containing protein [Clostridiales bacterium]|nr:5'-nucleotidase C-terminal domain-containing protein [Clostridiales bacterium]
MKRIIAFCMAVCMCVSLSLTAWAAEAESQDYTPESAATEVQEDASESAEEESQEDASESAEVESQEDASESAEVESLESTSESTITILYTNDVHTYIDEDVTYSMVAAYRDTLENVLLVDAGDHIQGTAYGGMDNGATIIQLMNAAGYDLATLGNHEFDYGMEGALNAIEWANFPYVSCNFYHLEDGVVGENVLDSYQVFEVDGVRIAFVGITTPESISKSTPKYFQDDDGNYIYGIAGGTDGQELYSSVQKAIDTASQEADYVIALGHLGVDSSSTPWTSEEVIANTTGLDAFIDGHSHTTMEAEYVTDLSGDQVLLTQTGCYFSALGQMTIQSDGTITTELLSADDLADVTPDAEVQAIEQAWIDEVDALLGEKIAETDIEFTVNDEDGNRLVRKGETNLGDFNADAYYWYLNEADGIGCDIAIMNGGGVRASVEAGDWTYLTCKTVNPFGNVLCVVEVSGQDILDALEYGARYTTAGECGGFLHVAGLTYEIDTAVESTVQEDENETWVGGPSEYRVTNVKVYNKETGEYEDLDLTKTYSVAGTNYTLRNCGDGFNMFSDSELIRDYIVEDYLATAAYAQAFADSDGNGYANLSTATSPLAAYEGYLLNYENATGSGRISIYCSHVWDEGTVTTEATATEDGVMTYTCTVCGETKTEAIPATGAVDMADCTVTLSETTYTYDGTAKTPAVTVTDADGNTLTEGTDYTVAYSDNTAVGAATVTVTGIGNYTGTATATFTIEEASQDEETAPAATKITSAVNKAKGIKLTWNAVDGATSYQVYRKIGSGSWKKVKTTTSTSWTDTAATSNGTKYQYKVYAVNGAGKSKASATKTIYRLTAKHFTRAKNVSSKKISLKWTRNTKATGYQIQYSTSSSFSSSTTKTVTVKGNKKLTTTLKNLKKGKTYYIRMRPYKTSGSVTSYAGWSKVKTVKVKK